jgi:hypothetical protein
MEIKPISRLLHSDLCGLPEFRKKPDRFHGSHRSVLKHGQIFSDPFSSVIKPKPFAWLKNFTVRR